MDQYKYLEELKQGLLSKHKSDNEVQACMHAYENGSGRIYVSQTLRNLPDWLIERAGAYLMFRSYECSPSMNIQCSEKMHECLQSLSLGECLGLCNIWPEEFVALKIPFVN